jgi:alpha-L-fucosidase 2
MEASVKSLEAQGTKAWVGYSFAWLGNLYARMHNGEKAAQALRTFATCFCLPNSFHANGDQCGGKFSGYTYRPFTLEGNFAFAAGVQEMLIQSHGGLVKLFPAVPESWKDIQFTNLRTEGAFLITASVVGGELAEVTIVSEKGGDIRLELPMAFRKTNTHAGKKVRYQLKTVPGQTIKLAL